MDNEVPNAEIWDKVEGAIESLTFWKNEDCKNDNKQQLKKQVKEILQNYIKQGYTTMKEVYDANTEIILQNPNTNKCKGIELGQHEFQYGECRNDTQFHICCGVKYDFEENKYTYYKDGKPVEVTDEKRIEKIQAIANGMDTDLDVGFCDKYFSWCCCCNSNAGLKALRDDGEYININHYQYKM